METPIGYPIPPMVVERLPVLPDGARRLLVDDHLLAYRFTAYQSDSWPVHLMPGVEVCVARPFGGNRWLRDAQDILELGLVGMGDAILSLTQPPPFVPTWPITAWTKAGFLETAFHHRPKPKDNALKLHLVVTKAGFVLEQDGWMEIDHHGAAIYDHVWCASRGLSTSKVRANDPPAAILIERDLKSAHRRLALPQEVRASFDAWISTLPERSPTHDFLPGWGCIAPPSREETERVFLNR